MTEEETTIKTLPLAQKTTTEPEVKEKPVFYRRKQARLFIGIPNLKLLEERRCPLSPRGVYQLVQRGHRIRIQKGAGQDSGFSEYDFAQAGAEMVDTLDEVLQAQIILQTTPPDPDEISKMREGQVLMSPLQMQTLSRDLLLKILRKKIIGIAFEYLEDKPNSYPVRRAMSQIAGVASVLIAAELLVRNNSQQILLANITGSEPPKVVIIGAGTVGEYAVRTAVSLGLQVTLFDYSIERLLRVQRTVQGVFNTQLIYPDALERALKQANVAIGALAPKHGRTPLVVTEDMVKNMKPGSVIVDVSIDHGGCFETSEITSHSNPTFTRYGIIHYCVPNIPSRYSRTASVALSNILTPLLLTLGEQGGVEEAIRRISYFRTAVYAYKGILCNLDLAERFLLKHVDLSLVLGPPLV